MKRNKFSDRVLVRMLSVLDRKQKKQFRAYISCSIYNSSFTLIELFDSIQKLVLDCPEPKGEFIQIQENLGIAETTLEKSCSKLLRLLTDFVPLLDLNQVHLNNFPILIKMLRELGLESRLIEREYKKQMRKLKSFPESEEKLFVELSLGHQMSLVKASEPRSGQGNVFNLQMVRLETYYLVSRLKYSCAKLNESRIFKNKNSADQEKIDVNRLSMLGGELPLLGQAYQKAFFLLKEAGNPLKQVKIFWSFLGANGSQISLEDRVDLYGYLLNSCFRGLAQGQPENLELVAGIYDSMLKQGLLIQNNNISSGHFKNIVSTRVQAGKLEEARQFIDGYQVYLNSSEKGILVTYTLGLVDFYSQNYSQAISRFLSILADSPKDLFWGLEARNMLWKSYFEGYEELGPEAHNSMLKLYHSFRVFVSRNHLISDYHKSCYLNFIKIFNRLILFEERKQWTGNKENLMELLDETRNYEHVSNKKWLIKAISKRIEMFD